MIPGNAPVPAHVTGTHVETHELHCPATPSTPQPSPAGQLPQSSTPPQPSGAEPQLKPSPAHVLGVQASLASAPPRGESRGASMAASFRVTVVSSTPASTARASEPTPASAGWASAATSDATSDPPWSKRLDRLPQPASTVRATSPPYVENRWFIRDP